MKQVEPKHCNKPVQWSEHLDVQFCCWKIKVKQEEAMQKEATVIKCQFDVHEP